MTNVVFILLLVFIISGGLFYIKYDPPEDASGLFILLITLIAGPICWCSFLIQLVWQIFKYFIFMINHFINSDMTNEYE